MNSVMNEAAVFYLQYCGKRGTPKQVAALIKAVGPFVIRMATERGFSGGAR